MLNDIVALTLLHGAKFLSVFDQPQRDALAMLFLGLHGDGINLANIFNGRWLVPFGILAMRSGFIPRVLGILLIADCCALVAAGLTALLLPAYRDTVSRVAIIPELGELWNDGMASNQGRQRASGERHPSA